MRAKPSIADDGTIFIGTEVGVTAVEAGEDSASIKWTSPCGTIRDAGLTLGADGTTLYAAVAYDQSGEGSVHALDVQNGGKKWTFNPPECSANPSLRCYFGESTPAVGADGTTIFVGSDDTYVYALPA